MRIIRQILNSTLFFVFIIALFACSKKDGDWDDNIKLSTKDVAFSALGDSVTVTTGGAWWWISDVCVNRVCFYDFRDVDLESDTYWKRMKYEMRIEKGKIEINEGSFIGNKTVVLTIEISCTFG